jgi:hypothetical protein
MPVRCISSLITWTTRSRFLFVSDRVLPSGATSRSWKQKNGAPSFSMNSKATRTRLQAFSRESWAASQGRSMVPGPNGSEPVPRMVCQ